MVVVDCGCVTIERFDGRTGNCVRSIVLRKTHVEFGVDDGVLFVPDALPGNRPLTVAVAQHSSTMKIFSKFIQEGKAAIRFGTPLNVQVLMSKASNPRMLLECLRAVVRACKNQHNALVVGLRFFSGADTENVDPNPGHAKKQKRKRKKIATSFLEAVDRTGVTEEQMRVLQRIQDGQNLFLSGGAGVGKTWLLRRIIAGLRALGKNVAVTASTGIASVPLGGETLFQWAGVGSGADKIDVLIKRISRKPEVVRRWCSTQVLIIDEVSMIDGHLFTKLDAIGRLLRKKRNTPWGGIQIILVGDFFQLRPVDSTAIFCFASPSWKQTIGKRGTFVLTQVFRQNNMSFIDVLARMRQGECSKEDEQFLRDNTQTSYPDDGSGDGGDGVSVVDNKNRGQEQKQQPSVKSGKMEVEETEEQEEEDKEEKEGKEEKEEELLKSSQLCRDLCDDGILVQLIGLINTNVHYLLQGENDVFGTANIRRPDTLIGCCELVQLLLGDPIIKNTFKKDHPDDAAAILSSFLCVRGLIVHQDGFRASCAEWLLRIVKVLFSESDDDKRPTIRAYIQALADHATQTRTNIFILEQLCNLIHPSKPEKFCWLILKKVRTQEDFIRGHMKNNPYKSTSMDGPLMSHVKAKICADLSLPKEDNFVELLVNGKIVSLDLPIMQVFKQVWKRDFLDDSGPADSVLRELRSVNFMGVMKKEPLFDQDQFSSDSMPMVIQYRLTGLDGEATEPVIDSLPEVKETSDPEVEFVHAAAMIGCNGTTVILDRLSSMEEKSLKVEVDYRLFGLLVKTLSFCAKLRAVRRHLLTFKWMHIVMDKLVFAVRYEDTTETATQMAQVLINVLQEIQDEKQLQHVVNIQLNDGGVDDGKTDEQRQQQEQEQQQDSTTSVSSIVASLRALLSSLLTIVSPSNPFLRRGSELYRAIMQMLPLVTLGDDRCLQEVVAKFDQFMNWKQLDDTQGYQLSERTLHNMETIATFAENIPNGPIGAKIRDYFYQHSIVHDAVEYMTTHLSNISQFSSSNNNNNSSSSSSDASSSSVVSDSLVMVDSDVNEAEVKVRETSPSPPAPPVKGKRSHSMMEDAAELKKIHVGVSVPIEIQIDRPSLPYLLRLLTGLCRCHEHSQTAVLSRYILHMIHRIEGIASSSKVGPLAENLLTALTKDNSVADNMLDQLRKETRRKKMKKAMAARAAIMKQMGIKATFMKNISSSTASSSSGSDANVPGSASILIADTKIAGMDQLQEEKGIKCMICHEGPKYKPEDALGIYVFCKEAALGEMNNEMTGVTTVTHFNIIHLSCHQKAASADRRLKPPKSEWDGATIRNSHTLCNNLFPVATPGLNSSFYGRQVDAFWQRLPFRSRFELPYFEIIRSDMRMLLARFAWEESFSEFSKGGGRESNSKLLPFMFQMGLRTLITLATSRRDDRIRSLVRNIGASPSRWKINETACEVTENDMIVCLFLLSHAQWQVVRVPLLIKLLTQSSETRSFPSRSDNKDKDKDKDDYSSDEWKATFSSVTSSWRPCILMWALTDCLHNVFSGSTSEASAEDDEGKEGEEKGGGDDDDESPNTTKKKRPRVGCSIDYGALEIKIGPVSAPSTSMLRTHWDASVSCISARIAAMSDLIRTFVRDWLPCKDLQSLLRVVGVEQDVASAMETTASDMNQMVSHIIQLIREQNK